MAWQLPQSDTQTCLVWVLDEDGEVLLLSIEIQARGWPQVHLRLVHATEGAQEYTVSAPWTVPLDECLCPDSHAAA